MADIFALLEDTRAIDIFHAAGTEATSPHPVVRGIIDNKLGHVCLARSRPQDDTEERIIRLHTGDPERATRVLSDIPGVVKVGTSFDALTL